MAKRGGHLRIEHRLAGGVGGAAERGVVLHVDLREDLIEALAQSCLLAEGGIGGRPDHEARRAPGGRRG